MFAAWRAFAVIAATRAHRAWSLLVVPVAVSVLVGGCIPYTNWVFNALLDRHQRADAPSRP